MLSDQKPDAKKTTAILPIQYLRGLAALMVVWHHAPRQIPSLERFIPSAGGVSGVDLFFAISGFIMVVTTTNSRVGPLEFIWRRIVRVVPLYWLMTLLMVAIALMVPSIFRTLVVEPDTLFKSLFFVPHFSNSFPDQVFPLLVPGWTLNYEMFFYVMFSLSLLLPANSRIYVLALGFFALVLIGVIAGPFQSAAGRTYTNPILLEFVAGAMIGAAWRRGWVMLPISVALILLVIGFALLMFRGVHPWGAVCGSALILWAALTPKLADLKSCLLEAIGNASYSLYLTHIFTLGIIRSIWIKFLTDEPTLLTAGLYMCIAIIGSTIVALAVYRFVETPLLRFFSSIWRG